MRRFGCLALLRRGVAVLRRTYGTPIIPQIILDQLKQVDDIGRNEQPLQSPSPIQSQPSYLSKQIFLLPAQIRNRQKLFTSTIESYQQRTLPNVDTLEPLIPLGYDEAHSSTGLTSVSQDGNTSIIADIERFKPTQKVLSKMGYTAVENNILRAFTKSQLREYLRQTQNAHLRWNSKSVKKALLFCIMLGVWEIVCLEEFTNAHDLLTHESVPLRDRDVFLLLSHNAHVLQYVARGGAKLSLAARDEGSHRQAQLKLKGTASQVHTAQVNMMSILSKATHTRMDLSLLMRLFKEKREPYELHMVGRYTEMYFEPMGHDIYDLLTLSVGQVKRCKRLLLWMLDYVQHRRESLITVGEGHLIPYVNEDALQWTMRGKTWNILRAKSSPSPNELLRADLARFSDEKLQEQPDHYSMEIADAKGRFNLNSRPQISQSEDFDIMRVLKDTVDRNHVHDGVNVEKELTNSEVQASDSLQEMEIASEPRNSGGMEELDLLQEMEIASEPRNSGGMEELVLLQEMSETSEPRSSEEALNTGTWQEIDTLSEPQSKEKVQNTRISHNSDSTVSGKIDFESGSTSGFALGDHTMSETSEVPVIKEKHECAAPLATSPALSSQQIDSIYSQLVDFSYRSHLNGVAEEKLNSPIFTATLGNILYEAGDNDSAPPNEKLVYKFTSNVALANDKVLSLPLFDEPAPDTDHVEHTRGRDPHTYALQIKFLPSPFPNEVVGDMKSEDQIKYPPVEMWIELNTHAKADIDTLMLVLVEGENNCHISLAESKADLKVCCQLSGNLLRSDESEITTEATVDNSDLESILLGTSKRYSRFDSQPGIAKFLEALTLDFSGKTATIIEAHIDLIIKGETVRYHHISTLYRRQINFSYINPEEEERMVQLNIVEGGALGGRRTEINLVGDVHGDVSREEFGKLMLDSQLFVAEL